MTSQEIKTYFSRDDVFLFAGSLDELHSLMVAASTSYNYLRDQDRVYVVHNGSVDDQRLTVI